MPTYTALINPIAGGGHALRVWRPIADLLAARGVEVSEVRTRGTQHAIDTAAERAHRGETVIAVGGDGLVREVAAGVFGSGNAMAIVPAGRGNDLARKLDLPTTTGALTAMLEAGRTRRVDVIEAAGQVVLGNVYVGIDSVATEAINNTRWLPGRLVYRLAPVGAILRWQAPEFRLSTPDWSMKRTLHQVVVANSGRYGYGLNIVPSARMDDGKLDVLTVGNAPKRKVVKFINKAKTGQHLDSDEVEVRTTTEITLDADSAVPVHADGDYLGDLPVTVRLHPAALDLVVP